MVDFVTSPTLHTIERVESEIFSSHEKDISESETVMTRG